MLQATLFLKIVLISILLQTEHVVGQPPNESKDPKNPKDPKKGKDVVQPDNPSSKSTDIPDASSVSPEPLKPKTVECPKAVRVFGMGDTIAFTCFANSTGDKDTQQKIHENCTAVDQPKTAKTGSKPTRKAASETATKPCLVAQFSKKYAISSSVCLGQKEGLVARIDSAEPKDIFLNISTLKDDTKELRIVQLKSGESECIEVSGNNAMDECHPYFYNYKNTTLYKCYNLSKIGASCDDKQGPSRILICKERVFGIEIQCKSDLKNEDSTFHGSMFLLLDKYGGELNKSAETTTQTPKTTTTQRSSKPTPNNQRGGDKNGPASQSPATNENTTAGSVSNWRNGGGVLMMLPVFIGPFLACVLDFFL